MYRSKKANKWIPFIECMLNGLSLRKTAEKIGITHVISFYWRHKVLSALARESIGSFEGLVEVDETYFLESTKDEDLFRIANQENVAVLLPKEVFPRNKSVS